MRSGMSDGRWGPHQIYAICDICSFRDSPKIYATSHISDVFFIGLGCYGPDAPKGPVPFSDVVYAHARAGDAAT